MVRKKENYWLTITPGHLLLFQVVYYGRSLFCAQAAQNFEAIRFLFWYVLRDNLVGKRWEKRLKILKTGDSRVFRVKTVVLFGYPKTEKQALQLTIRLTVKICPKCDLQIFTGKTTNQSQNDSIRRKVTWELAPQKTNIYEKKFCHRGSPLISAGSSCGRRTPSVDVGGFLSATLLHSYSK